LTVLASRQAWDGRGIGWEEEHGGAGSTGSAGVPIPLANSAHWHAADCSADFPAGDFAGRKPGATGAVEFASGIVPPAGLNRVGRYQVAKSKNPPSWGCQSADASLHEAYGAYTPSPGMQTGVCTPASRATADQSALTRLCAPASPVYRNRPSTTPICQERKRPKAALARPAARRTWPTMPPSRRAVKRSGSESRTLIPSMPATEPKPNSST
jgi:hypothetical protein